MASILFFVLNIYPNISAFAPRNEKIAESGNNKADKTGLLLRLPLIVLIVLQQSLHSEVEICRETCWVLSSLEKGHLRLFDNLTNTVQRNVMHFQFQPQTMNAHSQRMQRMLMHTRNRCLSANRTGVLWSHMYDHPGHLL